MSYFLISAGRVAMGTVQYHSASPPNALRLSHHPVWWGNPVYTLWRAVDIWTHAIFLILLLCRRADTQRCDVSTPPTCRALKSPGSASGGGGCCVCAVGALWMSCAAGLCCTEGCVTLTNQTQASAESVIIGPHLLHPDKHLVVKSLSHKQIMCTCIIISSEEHRGHVGS